jgi:hypothetical protein
MLRTILAAAILLTTPTFAFAAIDNAKQIATCKQGVNDINATADATKAFAAAYAKVKGGSSGDDTPNMDGLLDGERLTAVNDFYKSFKAMGPVLKDFDEKLARVQKTIGDCANGNLGANAGTTTTTTGSPTIKNNHPL